MARAKSTIGRNPLAAVTPVPDPETVQGTAVERIAATEAEIPAAALTVETMLADTPPCAAEPAAADGIAERLAEPPHAEPLALEVPEQQAQVEHMPHPAAPQPISLDRRRNAMKLVRRHMAMSAAAGVLPLPAVDVAAAVGVQVNLLRALSQLYGVAFDAALARQLVLALFGGSGSVLLALPAASAVKTVPVVGGAASLLLSPAFATLSCYGTGQAFIRHFEAGGTLESFAPAPSQSEPLAA